MSDWLYDAGEKAGPIAHSINTFFPLGYMLIISQLNTYFVSIYCLYSQILNWTRSGKCAHYKVTETSV